MDKNSQKIKRPKRQPKVEENWWDCSVCTFRNTASEAFKCLMCDVRKGTSTRKPRLNSALVAQQATQQVFPGGSGTPPNSSKSSKLPRNKNKRTSKYVRLKNIDRSSGQTREVTVNQVTVVITEYKPKPPKRHDSSESYSESNDSLRS